MNNKYLINRLEHIVILGTGIDALRCMNKLSYNNVEPPEYFIVNHCQQKDFAGYPVLECEKNNIDGKYILVSVKESTYCEVQKQLTAMGLVEFRDFIFYEWMFKKLVLLHGNCHMDLVESYLRSSNKFNVKYSIYPNPRICLNTSKRIPIEVLENVDLWIHEDIQEANSYGYFLSDNYLKNYIEESAIEIVIPHLFGLGKMVFPYSNYNKNNAHLSNNVDKNGMFPHADALIDECVERGLSVEKIVEYCMNENALGEREVIENFQLYMEKIHIREEKWDIKIYDFIKSNYRSCKLFYDMGHPTNIIFEFICRNILKMLGIEDSITTDKQLDEHEVPVYPTVKKYLHLEWQEEKIRKSTGAKRIADEMDIEEYIKEYLFWCYHI